MIEQIRKWREKITNLSHWRIPNNLYPQGDEALLKCGRGLVTSFQRIQYGNGKKRINLQWRNLTKNTSARWSRLTLTVISHVDSMYPWYRMWWNGTFFFLTSLVFFPKIHNPSLIMRKIPDKSQLRDTPQNTWPVLLWNTSSKTRKVWETVTAKRSLRRHDN